MTLVPHWLPHVMLGGGGVQHVPLSTSQMSVECSQSGVPFTPQATACMQLFCTVPQFLPPQATDVDSGRHPQPPLVQVSPPSQVPQLTGLPQLSVVSPQRFSQ
jgi:hypothetical protein